MSPTVAILGTRYPDFSIEHEILDPLGVEVVSGDGESAEAIVSVAAEAEVILAGSRPRFDAEVLSRLTCRAIVRSGIGVDSVDLDAARRGRAWVVNVPDFGAEAVALHTLSMVLAALRRLPESDRVVKAGAWGFDALRPMRLPSSLTAGLVGFGRIGRRVAELLTAVGFDTIVVHDPYAEADNQLGLEDLFGAADVISLHAPPPSDGNVLIGEQQIQHMKEHSVLVNTARGSLVDSSAVAAGMARRRPTVAAFDVFSPEPPDLDVFRRPVDVTDRLILSPHTAWYTEETQRDLRIKSAWEARRIIEGQEPLNAVVRPEEAT